MKEDFLHYVWNYKKFDFSNLKTTQNEDITLINSGFYSQLAGPDFFNAQITISDQKWAGNIEIHVKSSDWYLHHHEKDVNYDNVILHVVWEHDTPVFRKDNSEIPVLELKNFVSNDALNHYLSLTSPKSWIYCENEIATVDEFIFQNWQERLFFERLERKSISIEQLLLSSDNHWEAVLFCMLSKNFGLNTNGEAFLKMASTIPFAVIRKESFEVENLESLFFGTADLFPNNSQDNYTNDLIKRFNYISQKHQLIKATIAPVQFFKHRPDNFPTIRLAQLAMLYHTHQNLFSRIIETRKTDEIYQLFNVSVSKYWETHYQFDRESSKKKKSFSKSFIDLLIINTIIPFQFAYAKSQGKEISETIVEMIQSIKPEKNACIDKFAGFGINAKNAFETQSLLQLKNEYCIHGKCLQCGIGIELLKS